MDLSTLRSEHDRLQYNPAEFFEEKMKLTDHAAWQERHPHDIVYRLVPMTEALSLYKELPQSSSEPSPSWCCLQCFNIEDDAGTRMSFTCDPPPCQTCSGEDASYKLDVSIETDMELCCKASVDIKAGLQLSVPGKSMGVEVKDLVVGAFEFKDAQSKDIVPGQLLLTLNGASFGDCDTLRQVLGERAVIRHATLTVEIYGFVMSEPEPKRPRTCLADSNLAGGGSLQAQIQLDDLVEVV